MTTERRKTRTTIKPGVVILGTPPATDRVQSALRTLHVGVATATDIETATSALHGDLIAVVVAGFGFRTSLQDATARLAVFGRSHCVPIVVTVGEGYERERAQRLYRRGASAVLAWPTEALLLSRVLESMARTTKAAGYPAAADDALARAVEARLEHIAPDFVPHVSAREFGITLTGVVRSLADRMEIESHLTMVPGVQSVDASGLLLDIHVTSDVSLGRRARAELMAKAGVDTQTLGVSAHDGHVVLAGTVRDTDELDRVLKVASELDGVRGIDNHVAISGDQKKEDRDRAAQAKVIVDEIIVDHDGVRVSVFGPVAVLTGRSADRIPMRRIESRLHDVLGLDRVVDSIDVRA